MLRDELALKRAIVSNFSYGGNVEDYKAMMEIFTGGFLMRDSVSVHTFEFACFAWNTTNLVVLLFLGQCAAGILLHRSFVITTQS